MDSRTGKKIRLGRMFRASGRCFAVAYSHGLLAGPQPGMNSLAEMKRVMAALEKTDAVIVAPGLVGPLEASFIGRDRPSLILHMDYMNVLRKVLPSDVPTPVSIASVEAAAAAGADGILSYLYIGFADPDRERSEITRNANLSRECERLGLVHMIETLSAREKSHPEDRDDAAIQTLAARIAAELGADLVKIQPPKDLDVIRQIVEGCPAPVLVAGGARTPDPEDAFKAAEAAMSVGASGLVSGRNVFDADDPASQVARYASIVHGA